MIENVQLRVVCHPWQVFRSILAWCDEHNAAAELPAMFTASVRMQHLETFECRSLLVLLSCTCSHS